MQKILKDHDVNKLRRAQGKSPANVVLLRGCGSRLAVEPFEQRHGLKACMVAPTKIIAGLGMSLGFDVLNVPRATGDYKTSFHAKAEAIAKALTQDGYNFGFVHVKAIDDTGHDRAAAMKVGYFEVADKMVRQLMYRLGAEEEKGGGSYTVAITGDHSTPVVFGDHSHEPVPFAIAHVRDVVDALGGLDQLAKEGLQEIPHPLPASEQPALQLLGQKAEQRLKDTKFFRSATKGDNVCAFDETSAAQGCLGRFAGSQVLPITKQMAQS